MLLGKRPRPPIKRTTSMTAITVDVSNMDSLEPSDHHHHHQQPHPNALPQVVPQNINSFDQRLLSMVSPRNLQRNISNTNNNEFMVETSHFLRACGLCNCRLAPGRDIYMYRGDTAFCSSECREKKMKQDERKEKLSASSSSSSPPSGLQRIQ